MTLKPCPFCPGGETKIIPSQFWTGARYEVHVVEVKHWCLFYDDTITGSVIIMRAKTEAEAIEKWNTRAEVST